jgi:hypothetical protein
MISKPGWIAVAGLVAGFLLFLSGLSRAVDRGQFADVPDNIRSWFKSVTGPSGIPCCDISDGHRTSWEMRGQSYFVPVEGEWVEIPPGTIVRNAGNPFGEAVVWYVRYGGGVVIRCFVPASEV